METNTEQNPINQAPVPTPSNHPKWLIYLSLGALLVALCAIGYYLYASRPVAVAPVVHNAGQNWKTYNDDYGFSIKYPASWNIQVNPAQPDDPFAKRSVTLSQDPILSQEDMLKSLSLGTQPNFPEVTAITIGVLGNGISSLSAGGDLKATQSITNYPTYKTDTNPQGNTNDGSGSYFLVVKNPSNNLEVNMGIAYKKQEDTALINQILSSFKFTSTTNSLDNANSLPADGTTKTYSNSTIGISLNYPSKVQYYEFPSSPIFTVDFDSQDIKSALAHDPNYYGPLNIYTRPDAVKTVTLQKEIDTLTNIMGVKNFKQSQITVGGVKSTKLTYTNVKNQYGGNDFDQTQIYIPYKGDYLIVDYMADGRIDAATFNQIVNSIKFSK